MTPTYLFDFSVVSGHKQITNPSKILHSNSRIAKKSYIDRNLWQHIFSHEGIELSVISKTNNRRSCRILSWCQCRNLKNFIFFIDYSIICEWVKYHGILLPFIRLMQLTSNSLRHHFHLAIWPTPFDQR